MTSFQINLTPRIFKLEASNFVLLSFSAFLRPHKEKNMNVILKKRDYEHFNLGVESAPPAPNKLAGHPPPIGLIE